MGLSVIICTYNPQNHVILRCLDHVRKAMDQGGGVDEVIVVDNNSNPALANRSELQPYMEPPFRFVVEREQGLTPARLRGIREAKSELLVFVDDDNFVSGNFFAKGKEIADKNPYIGAFSGQVELLFESQPPDWSRKYWGLLVHRRFDSDRWSNLPALNETLPCGAGLFVRRAVGEYYLDLHNKGMRNVQLDRSANSLFSGGDNDLAACACDVGLGVGLFHELFLEHYIPSSRVELDYLLKLTRGIYASSVVLKKLRKEPVKQHSAKSKVANGLRKLFMNSIDRKFFNAASRGELDGYKIVKSMNLE